MQIRFGICIMTKTLNSINTTINLRSFYYLFCCPEKTVSRRCEFFFFWIVVSGTHLEQTLSYAKCFHRFKDINSVYAQTELVVIRVHDSLFLTFITLRNMSLSDPEVFVNEAFDCIFAIFSKKLVKI